MGRWRDHLKADPLPYLLGCDSEAINYWALRDLQGEDVGPPAVLWSLPVVREILLKQQADGSWRYPGGHKDFRTRESYDQLETFRQMGELVAKFGFTREHPAVAKAAEHLFTFQSDEGDFRGIYGSQYATTYHGAIMEVLIKAGYADDPRIDRGFRK